MACSRCQDIFEGDLEESQETGYDPARRNHDCWDLEKISNHDGCVMCHRSWQIFVERHGVPSSVYTRFFIDRQVRWRNVDGNLKSKWAEIVISAATKDGEKLVSPAKWYPKVLSEKESAISVSAQEDTNSTATSSESTMQIASNWIQNCSKMHLGCKPQGPLKKLTEVPTRLLELRQPNPLQLRLVETAKLSYKPSYMTLSHCWGSAIFFKLTADTLSQLKAGIPLASLPKTFQDAVSIAWRLGSKFLWIDSLCILQDSLSDWQQEAATMSNVYAGSLCNIVASASSDSNGGCFRQRDARFSSPSIIDVRYTNRPMFKVSIGLPDVLGSTDTISDAVDKHFPLFVRGWTVQERALAPRNLHFGPEYILWECETNTASEIYPKGSICLEAAVKAGDITTRDALRKAESHWQRIVAAYSKCFLTSERDKLVAIGGIAKRFAERRHLGSYLAGLWSQDLVRNLLWESQSPSKSVRPSRYRAPTWSWASLDGPIRPKYYWPALSYEGWVKLMAVEGQVQLKYLTDNAFGEVIGAKLEISGHVSSLTFGNVVDCSESCGGSHCFKLKTARGQSHYSVGQQGLFWDVEGDIERQLQTNLCFLLCIQMDDWGQGSSRCEGLILELIADATSVFRRCGVLKITYKKSDLFWASESPSKVSSDDMSFDGRRHTIWIV